MNIITANDSHNIAKSDSQTIANAIERACAAGCRALQIPRFNKRTGGYLWELDESILLPSDFTLILENCHLRLKDDTFCNIICNKNFYSKNQNETQQNIHIKGIGNPVLDGGNYNGFSEHSEFLPKNIRHNCAIVFCNVESFSIENLFICNHRYWGMCFLYCGNGVIRNIEFKADLSASDDQGARISEQLPLDYEHVYLQNSDGVDLRVGCHNILIENISGFTVDDTVALTALCGKGDMEYKVQNKSNDIHDIIIKNIRSYTFCWTGQVRLLAKDGCRIYGVSIDTVVNTIDESLPYRSGCSVMIGDTDYISKSETQMGEIFNVRVSNIHSRAIRAIRLTGPMSFVSFNNIFAYPGTEAVVNADSDTQLSNINFENIYCGENTDIDSIINFSGNVSGKVRFSKIYCNKTDYLIRNSGTVDVALYNANDVNCRIAQKTSEPKFYEFWWANKK